MAGPTEESRPFVVVLTGGPSSGKSSALALLRARLTARGFQVLTVPENATHFLANSDGFQPEWAGAYAQVRMQRIFLDYQLAQEEAFKAFASLHPTKRAVLLLDCCTLNSKVYVDDEQWKQVLAFPDRPPTSEEALMGRYDLVVHMMTCALEGHYEWGPGSNNPGRYHTPEQAKEQDDRCLQVFSTHPQLRVVPHCSRFDDKIEKVVEFVNDALHIEGLAGKRRRRTCRVISDAELEVVLSSPTTSASLVTSNFLDAGMQHSVRRRARIPSQAWLELFKGWRQLPCGESEDKVAACMQEATDILFERRSQVQASATSYMTRRVIHEEDYYAAVQSRVSDGGEGKMKAHKLVLRFLEGSRYFEILFFFGKEELIVDLSAEEPLILPPGWLQFTSSRDLCRQDSAWAATKGDGEEPPRKKRVLRPHSTEEAAYLS